MVFRASYGTLSLLGMSGRVVPSQRTAYFMLDGKCTFDCWFCSHARSAKVDGKFLSRVIWKEVDPYKAASMLKKNANVKRICFQVVSYKGYRKDLIEILKIFSNVEKKISVSVRALSMEEIESYFEHGVDTVGISIDAASPEIYERVRGGKMEKVLALLDEASRKYPGKIATHLIVGLGESEKDLVKLMEWLYERNIIVALFAFTPIKGTVLENLEKPPIDVYRRIQIARFLLEKKYVKANDFKFNEDGQIVDFGIDINSVANLKTAFLTSGCPDCTRPFYNESPREILYNIHDKSLLDQVPDFSSS